MKCLRQQFDYTNEKESSLGFERTFLPSFQTTGDFCSLEQQLSPTRRISKGKLSTLEYWLTCFNPPVVLVLPFSNCYP